MLTLEKLLSYLEPRTIAQIIEQLSREIDRERVIVEWTPGPEIVDARARVRAYLERVWPDFQLSETSGALHEHKR